MRLAFEDVGPGPVVVLLHGFPFDRSMWSNQFRSVGSSYRIIAPDLRGHGATAAPDGIYSVDGMADDVIELLDALQINGPVVVGGHSMGGYVAFSIAVRYPDRVSRLVLCNSRAAADSPEAARNREDQAARIEASGDISTFLDGMVTRVFAPATLETDPDLVRHWRSRMAKTPVPTIVGTLRGLATRPDWTGELARIRVPTLVVAGADDQIVPLGESRQIADAIEDSRLIVVPASGHLAPLENPFGVDRALLNFLEREN